MYSVNLSASRVKWKLGVICYRVVWNFMWFFVRFLPKFCSPVRIFVLRCFGARIGMQCLVLPRVKILLPYNLEVGDYVAIGAGVDVYNFAKVHISSMTVVSQDTFLCTGSHDYSLSNMPLICREICIGSECWIASGVFVGPGVSIADGIVVGVRSVVLKNLDEKWSVFGGFPAKRIKARVIHETGKK
jgi:putative colanic acid biosynthesis acetyltransferase WcaF